MKRLIISISTILIVYTLFNLNGCKPSPETKTPVQEKPELETSSPEKLGFNADSLRKIEHMLKKYVDKNWIPGGSVIVLRHGKIAYKTAVGWSDLSQKVPLAEDHIFRIASMTKPFTSVAIMQLYERGKLHLHDPLSKYIPEFSSPEVLVKLNLSDTSWESRSAKREITLHHLLTHTSGVPYAFVNRNYQPVFTKYEVPELTTHLNLTLAEKMAAMGKLPLAFDPGEEWQYGMSSDILGRVVEVASGMSLKDYFEANIINPLGLVDTQFFLDSLKADRLVKPYIANTDSTLIPLPDQEGDIYHPEYPIVGAKSYFSGGSGLTSTLSDYAIFSQTLLNRGIWGDTRILQDSTVNLMCTNQIDTISYPWGDGKFGYGFHVTTEYGKDKRKRLPGRFSWGGAFHTTFWIDPARDIVAIMMSQVLSNPHKPKVDNEFEQLLNESVMDLPEHQASLHKKTP